MSSPVFHPFHTGNPGSIHYPWGYIGHLIEPTQEAGVSLCIRCERLVTGLQPGTPLEQWQEADTRLTTRHPECLPTEEWLAMPPYARIQMERQVLLDMIQMTGRVARGPEGQVPDDRTYALAADAQTVWMPYPPESWERAGLATALMVVVIALAVGMLAALPTLAQVGRWGLWGAGVGQ